MVSKEFLELLENEWVYLFAMRIGCRQPERSLYISFRGFVCDNVKGGGSYIPEHWALSEVSMQDEIAELFITFIENKCQ